MSSNDDATRLTRREVVVAGGALGLSAGLCLAGRNGVGDQALAAEASAATACALTPEQTEGAYYIDDHLLRSDIREDRKGVLRWPSRRDATAHARANLTPQPVRQRVGDRDKHRRARRA